jgi:hypothetical protein
MYKIAKVLLSMLVISILIAGCGADDTSTPIPTGATGDLTTAPAISEETEDQSPKDTWTKKYGGRGDDNLSDILQTDDGGLYLLGGANLEYEPERHGDIYLILIDSNGEVIWEKTYGPDKFGQSITYTPDGNLLIAGEVLSDDTGFDLYLMKVDREGNELWSKTISGPMDEWVNTIEATTDGGYILVGNSVDPNDFITNPGAAGYGGFEERSNAMLTKTDGDGEVVWTHVFESEDNIMSMDGCQTPDGGYAVLATNLVYPEMGDDQLLLKVDKNGEELWTKTWEEGGMNGRDILLASDGNLVILSMFSSSGDPRKGDADLMLIKMGENGEELWTTKFGEPDMVELGTAFMETSDGGYAVVVDRTRDLYRSESEMLLLKANSNGQVIWSQVTGKSQHFIIQGIVEHPAGGYLLAASSYQGSTADIVVIKTDANGNVGE